jgi:arylsulfatase A-like enzyme
MNNAQRAAVGIGAAVAVAVVAVVLHFVLHPVTPPRPAEIPDAGLASHVDDAPAAPRSGPPDILLLTIDSLRADHVGTYGYDRHTAPTLAALAARGTLFRRAYTTSTWSVPAIASVLTGTLPAEHGVLHGHLGPAEVLEHEILPPGLPSLASALHDAGYRTVGMSASALYDASFGYGRGFDQYDVLASGDSADVLAAIGGRLDELRDSEAPYFLWIHLIDPHLPYTPREPQFTAWWPSTRSRISELDHVGLGLALPGATRRANVPGPVALEYLTAAYDSEIRAADDFLEETLTRLDDGNLAVVVTSNHGEELGDHGGMGHGRSLFEELVHVPLVVAVPGQTASETSALVSLIDVMPSLLEIADAPPVAGLDGISFVPAMGGDTSSFSSRDVLFETGGLQVLNGISDGRYQYGERVVPHPLRAMFDLQEDPYEQTDILAAHTDIGDRLRERMLAAIAAAEARRPGAAPDAHVPEPVRLQLTALGYGAQ